jgi:aerobic-type carbon monoxide dehydrogenase small subunit (CoxS/CutS family)
MNREVLMATMLTVNGQAKAVEAPAGASLLRVLRDQLDLIGAKYGCGEGQCGACTVLIDGRAVRSCITSLDECVGKEITTIEGLADEDRLHPMQSAFLECDALQCGYCTPGMILSGVALLKGKPHPTRAEILHGMNGNICRCGTYQRIVAAIEMAAAAGEGGQP